MSRFWNELLRIFGPIDSDTTVSDLCVWRILAVEVVLLVIVGVTW